MELGRYLVAESGVYVCEVIDKKVSRGEIFLVTNGGLLGRISNVGDSFVEVEVGDGMKVKVQRQAIAQLMPKGTIKEA